MNQDAPDESQQHEDRNFLATSTYQILFRLGWIFKTESVIMPAALDAIGATGWVRGCLPMLNRIGQSFPPLLAWPLLKKAPRQSRWLMGATLTMGFMFCLLSGIWWIGLDARPGWAQLVFLIIYALFFFATGINQLTLSTLIGKLIRAESRGRLMLVANTLGCVFSVACAWFILRHWLAFGEANFAAIFGAAGGLFIVSAISTYLIYESSEPVESRDQPYRIRKIFNEVWQTWTIDQQFRTLILISALYGLSMTLMPHYQNMGRVRLNLGYSELLAWLIIQNIGVAVFSIPAGWVADRLGNRLALRMVLALLTIAPVLALWFSHLPNIGQTGFRLVYFLLGLMPVAMRIQANFALEFTATHHQPRYLAAQSMAMALPAILLSALVGWMIDRLGFEAVFGAVIGCMIFGWYLTFRLHEPRHRDFDEFIDWHDE